MTKLYKMRAVFLVLSMAFMCIPVASQAQDVFINEIHYDNASTDQGEGVEVAGLAGTDLTGWRIEFYNGSNGSLYQTLNLAGILPDQDNGFGTAFFPQAGIQNGSPDGMALIDPANTIIEFLSYEGSFTAVGGTADGLISTDIGVSEASNTPFGNSLQLTGTGSTSADFTWTGPVASSYDAVNAGQSFAAVGPIDPVINEFVSNHTSTDSDEFVEIFGAANTDYSDLWIIEIEGDASGAGTVDEVIQVGTTDANGFWTTGFQSNAFENGTITLLLVRNLTVTVGTDLDTDNDGTADIAFGDIVDGVGVNDGGTGDFNYSTVVLAQGFDGSSFTVGGASRIPDGNNSASASDWVRNDFDGAGLPSFPGVVAEEGEAINTPGAANMVQGGGQPTATVLINEIDADGVSSDEDEFIELYDGGVGNTSLDGLVVVLYNGSTDVSYRAIDLDGFTTNTQGYFVLGNAAITQAEIVFPNSTLQNGADAVALYEADATDFPNGTAISTTDLIDAIVYDTNDGDDAELLTLLNAGQPQVNEDSQGDKDNHSLQRFPNGEGGLRNTDTYVAALPTPGAANTNLTEQVDVVINEIDADTPGSDELEFIELFDGGTGNSSLEGLVVVFYNGNGDASYRVESLSGFSTDANGYFVLGNAAVANVDLVLPNSALQNGADAVAIYRADAAAFPNGTVVTTDNLVDAVVYDTDDSDDAGLLVLLNAGQAQLNENANGDKDNQSLQRIPNGSGGARNTDTFMALTPTPGAENLDIQPPMAVTIAEARAAAEGTVVMISGILTVTDNFAGPAYIQDATGGIAVFDAAVHGSGLFNIGDSLVITATRGQFNDQVQLTNVTEVINTGVNNMPVPRVITLNELGNYPGQLVTILNTTFPNPGDLLFGNSNFQLTDASGSVELRIDNDVTALVGLAQPEGCDTLTGVVGRFRDVFQVLPRMTGDLTCAEEFIPSGDDLSIPRDETFDIATWNIEWFGSESNSPASSDAEQRDSVLTIIQGLDVDVLAVQEITDTTLFRELVDLLPGYDFILSDFVSRPNDGGEKQRVGFIYKTSTVAPDFSETKALLTSVHPFYNGGDGSFLVGYPNEPDRFYASGRMPFLLVADVTIDGVTERLHIVNIHARANSGSDAQNRYDMRKFDVEVLKDTLDTQYADANLILLGDYNDDLDFTVADIASTVSSYEEYVNDSANYTPVSITLSEQGFRSFVFRDNMIDHITTSNEADEFYIEGTARVGYEFFDSDFANTASDHFPVSARFEFAEEVSFNDCVGGEVVSFKQGKRRNGRRVHRFRSFPKKALGRPLENYFYNFVSLGFGGEITIKLNNVIFDLPGNDFKVFETTAGFLNIPCHWYPEKAEVFASEDGVNFVSLGVTCLDGRFDLATGGLSTAEYIRVKDVSNPRHFFGNADGYDLDGIICVNENQQFANARGGSGELQDAENFVPNEEPGFEVTAYPNPFTDRLKLNFNLEEAVVADLTIYNSLGIKVIDQEVTLDLGQSELDFDLSNMDGGMYLVRIKDNEGLIDESIKILKK
ncbi:MAG: endonuclease/exonuclease/phosphatase family protein [Bacteroidota bacterium]